MESLNPKTSCIATLSAFLFASTVNAVPGIYFPFNSQVPTVARVGRPYLFQLSSTTFAPQDKSFVYSLSAQPAWLTIDGSTRTLMGTPAQSDVGASTFTLTAADDTGAAHMACTLVVSSDAAPQLEGGISQQLAATANLSSSQPPVVTFSFIDTVQRQLYYYATLTDHTPLPSWLSFDGKELAFSGVAPTLSSFPQSWDIDLIASDVEGFAGTTASFTIAIGTQRLAFVPVKQTINITNGMQLQFDSLQHDLFRDGQAVGVEDLASVSTSELPEWLGFDASTLVLSGTQWSLFRSRMSALSLPGRSEHLRHCLDIPLNTACRTHCSPLTILMLP
ncbi:hypothetical protein KC326_g89 [Hortaea werneckii]|nr:hypothetical protein KC326_g89 [Hortaea werneckii]